MYGRIHLHRASHPRIHLISLRIRLYAMFCVARKSYFVGTIFCPQPHWSPLTDLVVHLWLDEVLDSTIDLCRSLIKDTWRKEDRKKRTCVNTDLIVYKEEGKRDK